MDSGLSSNTTYTYRISARSYAGASNGTQSLPVTTYPAGVADVPLNGMRLWLKADAGLGTDSAGNLGTWLDQSGNGNNVTSLGGSKPTLQNGIINNRPVVRMTASNQYLTGVTTAAFKPANITIMAVYRLASAVNWPSIIGQPYYASGWNPPYQAWLLSAGVLTTPQPYSKITTGGVGNGNPSNTTLLGTFALVSSTYDGSNSKIYVNGVLQGVQPVTGPISYGDSGIFYVGSSSGTGNDSFNGDLAEILVYDHALSDADRTAAEQYLNLKYQLFQQLPSAPTNLVASVVSPTQVALDWTPVHQAVSYSIERNSGSGFVEIAEVTNLAYEASTSSITSYIDSSVPAGNVIEYRVRAINYSGTSPYSNIAYTLMTPEAIDPTDGLSLEVDVLLGLDPLADNSDFVLGYPPGDGPPPPPLSDPNDHTPPVVTLLTPSQATLN